MSGSDPGQESGSGPSGQDGDGDRLDDQPDGAGPSPDRDPRVGEAADTHGTTVASEADTLTTGYGERTVDHRADDDGQAAIERHRQGAAAVGEPTTPTEPAEFEEAAEDS